MSEYLISAPEAAGMVRRHLADGNTATAVRMLTEAVARLIESEGRDVPDAILAKPDSTGDAQYDAVLSTAFLYAANLCGIEPPQWTRIAPLDHAYLWGGDGSESVDYIELIRRATPPEFLEKNILCRPRDWVNR